MKILNFICAYVIALFFFTGLNAYASENVVLRVCKGDKDFSPYTNLQGTGRWQLFLKKSVQDLPIDLKFHEVPRRRCLSEVTKNNLSDALFVEESEELKNYLSFPVNHLKKIDKEAKIETLTYVVLVRKGSTLKWNGKDFTNSEDKVLGIRSGRMMIPSLLAKKKIGFEDTGTTEQTIKKIQLKRIEGAVLEKDHINDLRKKMDLSFLVELPIPFYIYDIYLGVSTPYYLKNKDLVDKLWAKIKKNKTNKKLLHNTN